MYIWYVKSLKKRLHLWLWLQPVADDYSRLWLCYYSYCCSISCMVVIHIHATAPFWLYYVNKKNSFIKSLHLPTVLHRHTLFTAPHWTTAEVYIQPQPTSLPTRSTAAVHWLETQFFHCSLEISFLKWMRSIKCNTKCHMTYPIVLKPGIKKIEA